MKKLLALVAVLLVLANTADAQYKQGKDNVVGLNPLGLVFGIYSGEYGRFMGNGATEINVPFFYWKPLSELTVIGLGAQYRMYVDGNASGLFYGGGISFGSVSWDVNTVTFTGTTFVTTTESVTGVVVGPEAVGGYRWLWDSGLTLAPTLTLGYSFGKIETSSGTEPSTNPSGFQWGLGLGFGYNF